MFKAVARIHRRLDKVTSIMAFLDVRFSRNEESKWTVVAAAAAFVATLSKLRNTTCAPRVTRLVWFSVLVAAQISTQSRVALFSLVETGVLLGVTALQIWYIRRLVNNSASHLPGLR